METKSGFTLLTVAELPAYLDKQKVGRAVTRVQMHHTWAPSYKHFDGANHFARQQAMRDAHLARGFADIAQHFTIFPDGSIVTGRSLSKSPAGIVGANTGAVCIECFGNFDRGGDQMDARQADAIVKTVAALCTRFNLDPASAITYHAWWTESGQYLGDYSPAKSAKTCPGTAFFGGNTRAAYVKNLLPRITAAMEGDEDMKTYTKLSELPTWARPTFEKLIDRGIVAKDKAGNISVQESSLQPMVYLDRLGAIK